MQASNSGSTSGFKVSSVAEMRAFDGLPRDIRDLLNYACECWSAAALMSLSAGGTERTRHGVPVSRPDERGAAIRQIIEVEAAPARR